VSLIAYIAYTGKKAYHEFELVEMQKLECQEQERETFVWYQTISSDPIACFRGMD
jgi:hypothetical protein